jgi:hypothetical protein
MGGGHAIVLLRRVSSSRLPPGDRHASHIFSIFSSSVIQSKRQAMLITSYNSPPSNDWGVRYVVLPEHLLFFLFHVFRTHILSRGTTPYSPTLAVV